MAWIKVCGITRAEDAAAAASLGYDAIGFTFAESPHRVIPDRARSISRSLPPSMLRVGVFVNPDHGEARRLADYCGLDLVQLHGEEGPGEVARFGARAIKALRLRGPDELERLEDYPGVFAILLDAWDPVLRGGTGRTCDWELAASAARRVRVILAGGLNPTNVGKAIARVRPFGVDVCSGVDFLPGEKDHRLMRSFALAGRRAFGALARGEGAHGRT